MKQKALYLLSFLLLFLLGCSSSSDTNNAVSKDLETIVVSEDEFNRLTEEKNFGLDTKRKLSDQFTLLEDALDSSNRVIDDFLSKNPRIRDPRPGGIDKKDLKDIKNSSKEPRAVSLKNGEKIRFVTLDEQSTINIIAENIKNFPLKENQKGIYIDIYDRLPKEVLDSLDLPDPHSDRSPFHNFDIKKVVSLNDFILDKHDLIVESIIPDIGDIINFDKCMVDYGQGNDGDRHACDDVKCGYSPNGIMSRYHWNHKGDNSCVKNQGNRGSCVAFATISAAEYIISKEKNIRVNLSEQALYSEMTFNWRRSDIYDGFHLDAMDLAIKNGYLIPFENQWNYNPSLHREKVFDYKETFKGYKNSCIDYDETCSNAVHQNAYYCEEYGTRCGYRQPDINPSFYGYRLKSSHYVWDHKDPALSLKRILLFLALGDPVVISVPVLAQFDAAEKDGYIIYESGDKYNPETGKKSTSRGLHAMHVVAYINNSELPQGAPEGAGGGYLIVKNSWSSCWGDGGFVYLPYSFVEEYTSGANVLTGVH